MASLILMYVFYDENGDIKAITPGLDIGLSSQYSVATFPLPEVEAFLKGTKRTFDYSVKKVQRAIGDTFKLVRKEIKINVARTLENYMSRANPSPHDESILTITTYLSTNTIKLAIDPLIKDLLETGNEDEQDEVHNFVITPAAYLYFTKQNNPYHLLHTVIYSPKVLVDSGAIIVDIPPTVDLSDSSVYTKKIISSYGYKVRGTRNVF